MKRLKKVTKKVTRKSQSSNKSTTLTRLELPLDDAIMFDLLKWAIQKQSLEVITSLIDQGVNVNARSAHYGWTALHNAMEGSLEVVQLLIAKGANVNAKNVYDRTPLHWAILYGAVDVVQYLVDQGADVHAKDDKGKTPLDYAYTEEKKRILREAMDRQECPTGCNDPIDKLTLNPNERNTAIKLAIIETELRPSELTIIASYPGIGKTTWAMNVAGEFAIDNKQTVLFVSLEVAKVELAKRLVCSRAGLDIQKLRKGLLSEEETARFIDVTCELEKKPLYIDDTTNRTIAEISAIARHRQQEWDLKLIVIDHIGLIKPQNPDEPKESQIANIIQRLKALAMELNVSVLGLVQLDHPVQPVVSQLVASGAIEQYADVVLFMDRESDTDGDSEYKPPKITVVKQ